MRSLRKLARQKQSIAVQARRIERDERRLLRQLEDVLPSLGYRLLATSRAAGGKPKRLRCPQCPRRFAHPLPLARHVSATHRPKRRSPGRRKR